MFERYDFLWDGVVHQCETVFFRGILRSDAQSTVNDAPYHRGVIRLPASKVREALAYSQEINDAVTTLMGVR
jgi:hypothetical protein